MHRTGERRRRTSNAAANAKFFKPAGEEDLLVTRNRNMHAGHIGEHGKDEIAPNASEKTEKETSHANRR